MNKLIGFRQYNNRTDKILFASYTRIGNNKTLTMFDIDGGRRKSQWLSIEQTKESMFYQPFILEFHYDD